jgi:ankyrin repeat protein
MMVKRFAIVVVALVTASMAVAAETRESLVDAVKRGDTAAVSTLLKGRTDVNAADLDGTSALHWAVVRDNAAAVDALVRAGADVKKANRYGVTPLAVACTNGNVEIIRRLLDAGADANTVTVDGETVLMNAARTGKAEAVKLLLAHGAKVNTREELRGQNALMWAAAENNVDVVTTLVEAGAEINTRSKGGFTPLLFAVRSGGKGAVQALLDRGADVNDTIVPTAGAAGAGRGMRPPAAGNGAGNGAGNATGNAAGNNTVEQLLQVYNTGSRRGGGPQGTSSLVLAVTNAHFELASLLLEYGADPNADGQGWTALHQIAWTRKPPIQHGLPPAVPTGRIDSLQLAEKLLQYGANPNARMTKEPADGARNVLNRLGSTPFLQAAKLGDVAYMKLLVKYGADPNIKTNEGATAMMAAAGVGIWQVGESAGTNEEAFEAVKLCYELGNDINAVDVNGETALHGAAHRGSNDMVKFLVDKGAKMNVVNALGWTPWIIADGVFYPNTYNRRLDTAALLLQLGADPKLGKRRPEDLPPSESKLNAPALDKQ